MKRSITIQRLLSGLVITAAGVLPPAEPASADVVQCNGVWVNHECEGKVSQKLSEHKAAPSAEETARSEKRSLLHEITMKSIRAREDYEVRMSMSGLEDYCDQTTTTVDECRQRIADYEKELDRKVLRESKLSDDRRKKKEAEEKEKIAKTQAEASGSSVTIVQNNYVRYPRRRDFYVGNPRPYPGTSPGNQAGNNRDSDGPGYTDDRGYYVPKTPSSRGSSDRPYRAEWK